MNTTFSHSEQISPTLHTFYFLPEGKPHYIAGQFVEIYLPHPNSDNRGDKRWFTLSSAPHEPLLAITTHIWPSDRSTFKDSLEALQKGQTVNISSPLGDFVVPKNPDIPLLFIASGIGVTPYRSILEDLHINNDKRDITLVHAIRNENHAVFQSTFARLGDSYKTITDEVITADKITNSITPSPEHYIYVAGPEQLVEKIVAQLEARQIKRSQIYTDFFHGYDELS